MKLIDPEDIIKVAKSYAVKNKALEDALQSLDFDEIKLKIGGINNDVEHLIKSFTQHASISCSENAIKILLRQIRDGHYSTEVDQKQDDLFNSFKKQHPEVMKKIFDYILDEKEMPNDLKFTADEATIAEDYYKWLKLITSSIKFDITDKKEIMAIIDPKKNTEERLLGEFGELSHFYYYRLQAGPIIHDNKPGYENISALYERIWDCYAFSQFEAAAVLCRALLEETLKRYVMEMLPNTSVYNRKDKKDVTIYYPNTSEGKERLWDYDIHPLVKHIKEHQKNHGLSKEFREIYNIKDYSIKIIHKARTHEQPIVAVLDFKDSYPSIYKNKKVPREETLGIIRDTRDVVEILLDRISLKAI